MRQLLYIVFFVTIALACFWGTYKYVIRNESLMDSVKALKVIAPKTTVAPKVEKPQPIAESEAQKSLQSDIPQPAPSQTSQIAEVKPPPPFYPATQSELEQRAAEEWHTFTDQKGRTLVAQVISTSENALKIRRYSDIRIFFIPINLLCEQDQEFAAYLHQRRQNAARNMKPSNFFAPANVNDRFKNFNY